MYTGMENPNIVLPDAEDQLDWEFTANCLPKPLRYLTSDDLRVCASAQRPESGDLLAGALLRLAALLTAGQVVEDLSVEDYEHAFWSRPQTEVTA
jgi:hypothetical protein